MEILQKAMEERGTSLTLESLEKLQTYMGLVLEWNKKVNLTAITERDDFLIKHFADSLSAAEFYGFEKANKIIDIGTGAGFPGIPLAICYPDKHFVLTDSLNKRIIIIDEILEKLSIKNVKAIHSRAEDLGRDPKHREKYDMALSRAVAKLPVLLEYALPFVKLNGYFGSYKAGDLEDELADASFALKKLGGQYKEATSFSYKNYVEDHKILWFLKNKTTPKTYPRKAGTPAKQPLL